MNHFINFILKWTEGGATVDFVITHLTSSTAENHNFTTGYSLGWRHLSLQNKFGIKKIKLVTIDIDVEFQKGQLPETFLFFNLYSNQ